MRKGKVYVNDIPAGLLTETDEGYEFTYDETYMAESNVPVSLTLPLKEKTFFSKTLFSFFDGLIPEGWMLDIVAHNWKINPNDRFGILLVACKDPIGNVRIEEASDAL